MTTPLLPRKRVLAAAIETTLGTSESLDNGDAAFKVYGIGFNIRRTAAERPLPGSGGQDVATPEEASVEASFQIIMHGKGSTTNSANWAATFLPALGYAEILAGRWERAWPATNGLSIEDFVNGIRTRGRGMFGSGTMTFVPGKRGMIDCNFIGGYVDVPDDETILSGMSYETVQPPIWEPNSNTPFTFDSATNIRPSQVQIDFGNVLSLRPDPNSEGGFLSGWIGEAREVWRLDPESFLRATRDDPTKFAGGSTMAATLVLGSAANNRITITANLQHVIQPQWDVREGKVIERHELIVLNDSQRIQFG